MDAADQHLPILIDQNGEQNCPFPNEWASRLLLLLLVQLVFDYLSKTAFLGDLLLCSKLCKNLGQIRDDNYGQWHSSQKNFVK